MAAATALAHSFSYFSNPSYHILSSNRCSRDHRPTHLPTMQAAMPPPPQLPPPPDSSTSSDYRDKPTIYSYKKSKKTQTFLWNARIRGCVDNGNYAEAIELYRQMQDLGVCADYFTYPFVIKACACTSAYVEALKIHGRLIKTGLNSDIYICNSLINLYSKLGSLESAEEVFYEMPMRDLVSWNTMMNGYVSVGDGLRAIMCLRDMQESYHMDLDRYSLIATLAACSLERLWKQGKEIHSHVLRLGFELDVMVLTSVLDMYCKCEDMVSAERLFKTMHYRNVVAWNALMGGYVLSDRQQEALGCLIKMQEENNDPDVVTMITLLPSCAQLRAICQGRAIHGISICKGFLPNLILETALIDLYAKCGQLKTAEMLFDMMAERSLVSWNTMLAAYVQNGRNMEALELFLDLQKGCLKPDIFTISSVISTYAELASLRHGRQIHGHTVKLGYGSDTLVSNSISYMYAKCGDLCSSRKVFEAISQKDVISWNTIIMAYAIHGRGRIALEFFFEMQRSGVQPNHSTLVSVLSACSISGLVDEGWKYFNSMQPDYGIDPQIEHFGCMVDLLGREGKLEQAKDFIERMPVVPTARIWGSLLTASRNHNTIELAELAAEHIFKLEHDNTGCYIILSNMYADAGRWDDVERLRCLVKKEGLQKLTVRSIVELNSNTFSFTNASRSHPETNTIYSLSDIFSMRVGEAIYVSSTMFKLPEVLERKVRSPSRHSVRLAVCFGLISSAVGTPVLINKNVRICNSCHHAIKQISEFSRRQIIVGDSRIYHYFRDGICSCGDYW